MEYNHSTRQKFASNIVEAWEKKVSKKVKKLDSELTEVYVDIMKNGLYMIN